MAATPRRNSDSLASACCQSAQATPGPGAASVSTHFYTWTNSKRGQEKQPTHPYLSPCPPFSSPPPHPRTLYLGHHRLPSDLQSFFSFIFVLRWLCTYIPCALSWSLKTLFAMLWMYNLTIIYLVLCSQLLILMTNVCIKKKTTIRKKKFTFW